MKNHCLSLPSFFDTWHKVKSVYSISEKEWSVDKIYISITKHIVPPPPQIVALPSLGIKIHIPTSITKILAIQLSFFLIFWHLIENTRVTLDKQISQNVSGFLFTCDILLPHFCWNPNLPIFNRNQKEWWYQSKIIKYVAFSNWQLEDRTIFLNTSSKYAHFFFAVIYLLACLVDFFSNHTDYTR